MNVTEANAYYSLLRGLTTDADGPERLRALASAHTLTERARKALNAGPSPAEVLPLIEQLMDAIDHAAVTRCTLDVTYGWPDHRHRDADNWSLTKKAAVDGFVDAGLLAGDDDTHIVRQSLAAHVVDGAKPGHVELTFVLTEVAT